MRAVRRGALGFAVAGVIAAGGCWFAAKPYADDPLLRNGRGVWGGTIPARPAPAPTPTITPPHPPPGPTALPEPVTSPPPE